MLRLGLLCGLFGCITNGPEPVALDEAFFHCRVEPVLIANCGFYGCHGDPGRAFRVYGPNRLRLGVDESQRALALTDGEQESNYEAALAFAQPAAGYDAALLVVKPLATSVGGAFHGGDRLAEYGDVFEDPDDPELQMVRRWIEGETEVATCVP